MIKEGNSDIEYQIQFPPPLHNARYQQLSILKVLPLTKPFLTPTLLSSSPLTVFTGHRLNDRSMVVMVMASHMCYHGNNIQGDTVSGGVEIQRCCLHGVPDPTDSHRSSLTDSLRPVLTV